MLDCEPGSFQLDVGRRVLRQSLEVVGDLSGQAGVAQKGGCARGKGQAASLAADSPEVGAGKGAALIGGVELFCQVGVGLGDDAQKGRVAGSAQVWGKCKGVICG